MVNKYCQNKTKQKTKNKEKLQNLSEEEKDKKRKYAQERYQNFTEEEKEKRCRYYQECKQKLTEYRRNYYLAHKKYILSCFEDPMAIKFVFMDQSVKCWETLKIFYEFKDSLPLLTFRVLFVPSISIFQHR